MGSEDTIETQRPFWVIAGTRLKMGERVVVQHSFRAGDCNPFECAHSLGAHAVRRVNRSKHPLGLAWLQPRWGGIFTERIKLGSYINIEGIE